MRRFTLIFFLLFTLVELHASRQVHSLNDGWRFFFTAENSADNAREVNLPHTWELSSSVSQSGGISVANYIRRITPPIEWSGRRVFLKFYGVQREANIFINGKYCGEHRGGSTAFIFELTDKLEYGTSNLIHIVVNNSAQSDILPTSHEHNIDGGIYRDVELIITDHNIISPLYYGSSGIFFTPTKVSASRSEGVVDLHLSLKSEDNCKLNLSIIDPDGQVAFKKSISGIKREQESISVPFTIKNCKLWSPDSPSLYSVEATLSSATSEDRMVITSGLREASVAEGDMLRINGQPTPLRGVGLYHDAPIVGSALSPCDYDAQMGYIKELGANALHSAVMPHDRYLYELCDREGVMVWIDFPLVLSPYLSDIGYLPTERFRENGREQIREIVAQNYNHPSIIMWGLFSCLTQRGDDFLPYLRELQAMVKGMDPTRQTVAMSDQNGDMNTISDLIVWRQNIGWSRGSLSDVTVWRDMLHERWSHLRSGVCYGAGGSVEHQGSNESNRRVSSSSWLPESRQRRFHEEYAAALSADSLMWGVWISNMFDFRSSRSQLGENLSGLMSFDRRSRKDIFYLYKSLWRKDIPTLYIAGRRDMNLANDSLSLSVYSSEELAPMLFMAGDSLEMAPYAPAQFRAEGLTLNEEGWLVVRSGELADSIYVVPRSPLKQKL